MVFKQIDGGAPAKRTATVLNYFKTSEGAAADRLSAARTTGR